MALSRKQSLLKRGHPCADSNASPSHSKRPRRTHGVGVLENSQLLSPLETHPDSVDIDDDASSEPDQSGPENGQPTTPPSQIIPHERAAGYIPSPQSHSHHLHSQFSPRPRRTINAPSQFQPPSSPSAINAALSSPMEETQAFSQFLYPPQISLMMEVKDEEAEGVWGYLIPLSLPPDLDIESAKEQKLREILVLKRRSACPIPQHRLDGAANNGRISNKGTAGRVPPNEYERQEDLYEAEKIETGVPAGGYLIGRHPECDRVLPTLTISNRHCLLFPENKNGRAITILEDLSQNGTYVNDAVIGRNQRRELFDGDEISILDLARFTFRYPNHVLEKSAPTNGFKAQYAIQDQLGKGHFASVYLCVEKCSGMRYAVKHFTKRPSNLSQSQEKSRTEGLQQEIAVLMGVSHPNLLCLKDTFDEEDGVYLVLELAPEGELFNLIVRKGKLSETDSRKLFTQLFQGVKYLHERNIVHRDIKPENILLVDQELNVKLADFGLAKIIGEESFTTTLCGTPSYVAPEILTPTPQRRYTRAVDIWSLGVVLYIALCGFPPFSDELCTPSNPYSLSQQIKLGRFDYPSPYWDTVGDEALDLIDRMLCVKVEKRIGVDGCLGHPWVTGETFMDWLRREYPQELESGGQYAGWGTNGQQYLASDPSYKPANLENLSVDSTHGLRSAMHALNFEKRKPHRERTLLSDLNDVQLTKVIHTNSAVEQNRASQKRQDRQLPAVKLWKKNPADFETAPNSPVLSERKVKEISPAAGRDPSLFAAVGEKGDTALFNNEESIYESPEARERAREIAGE